MSTISINVGRGQLRSTSLLSLLTKIPIWIWLAVFAAALRFANLGSENLWYDESFTAWIARLPLPDLWKAIIGDVHPPLWYLVEWVNIRLLGSSEFALRVPAAIFGVCTVLLIWRLALALRFERRTAALAGLLAAVLPGALYYSQDARMYPMLATFVLLAALAAFQGRWRLFALAGIGAVYTQNLGLVYIACIGIAGLVAYAIRLEDSPTDLDLNKAVGACTAIVLAWLPWAPVALYQAHQIGQGFWLQPLTMGGLTWPLPTMLMGTRLAEPFQLHIYGAAVGATLVGIFVCRRWLFTRSGLIILTLTIGTPAALALASIVWRSVYLPRAMLPSALGIMLLWAYMLQHMSKPNRLVARSILIPAICIALASHYFPEQGQRFEISKWLQPIRNQWRAGDVIFHPALDSAVLSTYYLSGFSYSVKPEVSDLNQSLTEPTKVAMGFTQIEFDDLAKRGYHRAWLVASINPMTSAAQIAEISRILRVYPHWQISRQDNNLSSLSLYLVDLRWL